MLVCLLLSGINLGLRKCLCRCSEKPKWKQVVNLVILAPLRETAKDSTGKVGNPGKEWMNRLSTDLGGLLSHCEAGASFLPAQLPLGAAAPLPLPERRTLHWRIGPQVSEGSASPGRPQPIQAEKGSDRHAASRSCSGDSWHLASPHRNIIIPPR